MTADNDYIAGQGRSQFLVDSREAVAQIIKTRLLLETGEWFLNIDEGTPYSTMILGNNTQTLYDAAIQERIIESPGVVGITDYVSVLESRRLTVQADVDTRFGVLHLTVTPAAEPEGDRLDINFVLDSSKLL